MRVCSEEDFHYLTGSQLDEHKKWVATKAAAESMLAPRPSSRAVRAASVRERRGRRLRLQKSGAATPESPAPSAADSGIKGRLTFGRFTPAAGLTTVTEAEEPRQLPEGSSEDDWNLVRQKFGGERQATLVLQGDDGIPLVVRPGREIPGTPLPTAPVASAGRTPPSNRAKFSGGSRTSSSSGTAPTSRSNAAQQGQALAKSTSSSDEAEVFRPASNAPAVAEERLRLEQQPRSQPCLRERHSRKKRVAAELPTFIQGGQEYRILPRRTGESRRRSPDFRDAG